MADRMVFISWGGVESGREERGLEVFNEAMGLYGRMQQEGRIESFDVAIMVPNGGIDGYIALRGSAEQLAAVREDEEFQRTMVDADLVCKDLCVCDAYTDQGLARQIEIYSDAVGRVPQMH